MASGPMVALKALLVLGAFLLATVSPSTNGSTGGSSSISEPSTNYSNMDVTRSTFCAATKFPAGVHGTSRMEIVPRFYASTGLVEAHGGSAVVTNSSPPSMLDGTYCGVEDDVKFAGNRLDSVKERDLLFSTVALESFEAISLQESPSSAASASDAGPETQTQTAASTDDASPNTLYSRNHSKVDAVHISLCAADIFSEVQWTARTSIILPRSGVQARLIEVDGDSVVVANSCQQLPLKPGAALWGPDEGDNVKDADTRADFVKECDPTT
ncbi:hypothetical protein VaNZ11_015717, partial [Volvox africanus]